MTSNIILYTDESIEEVNNYFKTRASVVGVSGQFLVEALSETAERAFKALVGNPTMK